MAYYLAIDGYKDTYEKANDRYYVIDLESLTGKKNNKVGDICDFTTSFNSETELFKYISERQYIPPRYLDGKHHFVLCYDGKGNNKGKIMPIVKAKTSPVPICSKVLFSKDKNIMEQGVLRNIILSNSFPSYEEHNFNSPEETIKIETINTMINIAKNDSGYEYNDSLKQAVSALENTIRQMKIFNCCDNITISSFLLKLYHHLCCDNKMNKANASLINEYKFNFPNHSYKTDDILFPINEKKAFAFAVEYLAYKNELQNQINKKIAEKNAPKVTYEKASLFDWADDNVQEDTTNYSDDYESYYNACMENDEQPISYDEWKTHFGSQRTL